MTDQDYMKRAIELAKQGAGWTAPNPMVGAVVVKDGRIIGEGYHRKYGELHAERNALAACTEDPAGATIYVTLEPCCHYGKTPPCTEIILEKKIARVVIGSRDPNPKVAGKGARILREHGLQVEEDFMRDACDALNPVFFHYITTGLPYVVMKYAMTIDGKIATRTGASKWITGESAREHVHRLRGRYAAIMAGIGTVLADDPMLNCRIEGGHQPLRIVCDSKLRIPVDSRIMKSAKEYPTLIACSERIMMDSDSANGSPNGNWNNLNKERNANLEPDAELAGRPDSNTDESLTEKLDSNPSNNMAGNPADTQARLMAKKATLESMGAKVWLLPEKDGHIDLAALMKRLGEERIDSVLIEGGGTLNQSALEAGIVRHVYAYIAPKILGGRDAKTPVEGLGVQLPDQGTKLRLGKISVLLSDILLEYDVEGDMTCSPEL